MNFRVDDRIQAGICEPQGISDGERCAVYVLVDACSEIQEIYRDCVLYCYR